MNWRPGMPSSASSLGTIGRSRWLTARRTVAEAVERRRDGHAGSPHRGGALASDGHDGQLTRRLGDLARRVADRVRVQRAGESAVGREQDDEPATALTDLREERMVLGVEHSSRVREDLVELLAVRP